MPKTTTVLTPEQIERLRGLLAAGTPGPWKCCPTPMNITDANAIEVADTSYHIEDGGTVAQAEANAALILESINALPALLDSHEALRQAFTEAQQQQLKFVADLQWLESIYDRDGIAHVYASQMEKIFDRWLHDDTETIGALEAIRSDLRDIRAQQKSDFERAEQAEARIATLEQEKANELKRLAFIAKYVAPEKNPSEGFATGDIDEYEGWETCASAVRAILTMAPEKLP